MEYKPFRVDVGFGSALANSFPDKGGGVGFILNAEPKYAVIPQLSAGLKLEVGFLMREIKRIDDKGKETYDGGTTMQVNGSYLATFDYRFSQKSFRPFLGAGLGLYQFGTEKAIGSAKDDYPNYLGIVSRNNFGWMIRAGFDVTHLRGVIGYNFAGKDALNSNIGIFYLTIGAYFGGGRVK